MSLYSQLHHFYSATECTEEFHDLYAEAAQLLEQQQRPKAVAAALVQRGVQQHVANRIVATLRKWDDLCRAAVTALWWPKDEAAVEQMLRTRGAPPEMARFIRAEAHRVVRAGKVATRTATSASLRGRGG